MGANIESDSKEILITPARKADFCFAEEQE